MKFVELLFYPYCCMQLKEKYCIFFYFKLVEKKNYETKSLLYIDYINIMSDNL